MINCVELIISNQINYILKFYRYYCFLFAKYDKPLTKSFILSTCAKTLLAIISLKFPYFFLFLMTHYS